MMKRSVLNASAKVLVHALPYIQQFSGKTVVIKFGGNAMVNEELKTHVMRDIVLMRCVGINPILVHGGGPDINEVMKNMGMEPKFCSGLRVTDEKTMEVVEMVLAGKTNKNIVSHINKIGGQAVGICGKDGNTIVAEKETSKGDIGFVGRVVKINTGLINSLIAAGYIPVVSSVAIGEEGESYNINADTVAGELAVALGALKLILMTDVTGLYRDFKDKDSLISSIQTEEIKHMIKDGSIEHGMIPKVEACITARNGGVERAHIIDGRMPHALLVELFTDQGVGTMVC